MAVVGTRVRFTTDDYRTMAEVGILRDDDRVELIDGEVVRMSPIGDKHAHCLRRLDRLLHQPIGQEVLVSEQNPLRLGPFDEPQPDVTVLRFRQDLYPHHPLPDDVLLVIEVSDSSLGYDRRVKLPLYAAAGIREVWIVNLGDDVVERYTSARHGRYEESERFSRGDHIASLALPSLVLDVTDILG